MIDYALIVAGALASAAAMIIFFTQDSYENPTARLVAKAVVTICCFILIGLNL